MPTTDLTDATVNERLAELLGLDLTAGRIEINEIIIRSLVKEGSRNNYFIWIGNRHAVERSISYDGIWACRGGRSWQSDLEAHVSAYRRTPPNWAGDLVTAFALGEEMRKRNTSRRFVAYLWESISQRVAEENNPSTDWDYEFAMIHATPRQRAEAALRTLEAKENE